MKFIILILLIIFLIPLLFGFSILRMILNFLFGTRPKPRPASSNQQKTKQTNKQSKPSSIKKIFTREEGEYVDFEEIKDS